MFWPLAVGYASLSSLRKARIANGTDREKEKPNCRSSASAGEFISCFQQEKIAQMKHSRYISQQDHTIVGLCYLLLFPLEASKHFRFVLPSIFERCRSFLTLNPCIMGHLRLPALVLSPRFLSRRLGRDAAIGTLPVDALYKFTECLAELHIVLMASSSHT